VQVLVSVCVIARPLRFVLGVPELPVRLVRDVMLAVVEINGVTAETHFWIDGESARRQIPMKRLR
jgi:hypothetical protein